MNTSERLSDFDFWATENNLINDLFINKFDTGWQLFLDEPIKTCTVLPPEHYNGIDDKSVIYNFNDELFRSDNFITKHDGKHILFGGCSETEGLGGNIEDTWSHILYKQISKEEKCSGFFNLAQHGWGYDKIINNSLNYFKRYGYPEVYFILLPDCNRSFYYSTNNNLWSYLSFVPETNEKFERNFDTLQEYSKINKNVFVTQYMENFLKFLYSWKVFCELCEAKNIKLFFSTWDKRDHYNLMGRKLFTNFVELSNENLMFFMNTYYKNNDPKTTDIRKRDNHHGVLIHNFWANEFYKEYKK